MKRSLTLGVLGIVYLALAACTDNSDGNDSYSKREYSILQSYELEFRGKDNSSGPIIIHDALGSNRQLLAIPLKDKPNGYAILFCDASAGGDELIMPSENIRLSREDLENIRGKVELSNNVDKFLASRATR